MLYGRLVTPHLLICLGAPQRRALGCLPTAGGNALARMTLAVRVSRNCLCRQRTTSYNEAGLATNRLRVRNRMKAYSGTEKWLQESRLSPSSFA